MDLHSIFSLLNESALSGFAKIITAVQDTDWWKDHGLNLESEITSALSSAIVSEIDNEIINDLVALAEQERVKWETLIEEVSATLPQDERYKKLCEEMFKQEVNYLREVNIADPNQKVDPRTILTIAAKAIKHITPLTAIIGVQPMSGPVGFYYHMAFTEDESRMKLEVKKNTVAAMTRRLQARWAPEAMQDFSALHGIDFNTEIAEVMGSEVAHEVIYEMLSKTCLLASENEVVSVPKTANAFQQVLLEIQKAANDIAAATRRGPGNFIVCSPLVIAGLQGTYGSKFEPVSDEERDAFYGTTTTLMYCGMLNKTIKVNASIAPCVKDKVLIGFKGGSGELDTGLMYCPYIPFMMSGVTVDPATFTPQISTMTRYGMGTPKNGSAYYRLLDVEAVTNSEFLFEQQ